MIQSKIKCEDKVSVTYLCQFALLPEGGTMSMGRETKTKRDRMCPYVLIHASKY